MNLDQFNKDFSYPFSFINYKWLDKYQLKNIITVMFNNKLKAEKLEINNINFPKDIVEVYWYKKGINDEEAWQFIGKIKYQDTYRYIYYIGECDYTGFDCQGSMKLYISKSLKRILNNAVPQKLFTEYKILQNLIEKINE
jgi:hypothetical protein